MSEQHDENLSAQNSVPENEPEIDGFGFPKVAEPYKWPSNYGLDEATAIAIVPERALIFWELATLINSETETDLNFRLIRMKLDGDEPSHDKDWPVLAIGRFQDSGLVPGADYIWVIAKVDDVELIPMLVTNPVRMPIRKTPSGISSDLPSSMEHLFKSPMKQPTQEDRK